MPRHTRLSLGCVDAWPGNSASLWNRPWCPAVSPHKDQPHGMASSMALPRCPSGLQVLGIHGRVGGWPELLAPCLGCEGTPPPRSHVSPSLGFEAVSGCEDPAGADEGPATGMPGAHSGGDLDADEPGPGPRQSIYATHDPHPAVARRQGPAPTGCTGDRGASLPCWLWPGKAAGI